MYFFTIEENIDGHHLLRMSQHSHPPARCHEGIANKSGIVGWLKNHYNAVGMLKTKLLLLDVSIHLFVDRQRDSRNNCSEYLL